MIPWTLVPFDIDSLYKPNISTSGNPSMCDLCQDHINDCLCFDILHSEALDLNARIDDPDIAPADYFNTELPF